MIDQYFLVLTTIDLFVLTFMCILTKLSETLNGKQKRGFFLAFVLIGVISILEVITILVDGAPVHLRWLNILSNYLGFGLSPAVSLCLVYVLDKKQGVRRGFKTAVACEAAYLISLALTLPGGMVFSVSEENLYSRGDFFAFYVTAYFAALVYLAACTAITARVFQNRSRILIYPLIVFLAAETIIQIALPQLHVTWLCVTLLSVLYFIYCSEMWNQLDALTGLLNQNSYLNRAVEMCRSGEVLVVFDVDDFKQVNDRYGHVKGDICLAEIAACIKKAYARHGYCYRTGGDEFCVLLRDGDKEHACAPGLCAPAERAPQGARLPADGVVRLGRDFKRERRHGQGPRRPQHVPLQKRAQSPPHVRRRGRGVTERRLPLEQTKWRALVESICAERGLSVVLSWDMPQGYETANGTFDPVAKTLFLNPAVLQSAPEYEAMFYLVHELRHAEQYQHPERFDAMIRVSLPYVVLYDGTCFRLRGETWQECRLDGGEERFRDAYLAFLTRWTPMNSRRSG